MSWTVFRGDLGSRRFTSLRGVGATVTLEPWGSRDLPLLERLMGDPGMTEHLGDPESPDKLREGQTRYERLEGGDRMFKIVDVASGAGVGSVGFWTKEWRDEQVYEIGWMVVPEFQGRVILANPLELHSPYTEERRKLFYVAVTRATARWVVVAPDANATPLLQALGI
jgi:Acetyltransferase (GNAT) domain